jgi:hypothetical protein
MSSSTSPTTGNSVVRQWTEHFNSLSTLELTAKTIYTGESRVPLRERVSRMRDGKIPVLLRLGTPMLSKQTWRSLAEPRTPPPALPPVPVCPGAPRKGKVYELRRDDEDEDENDVLLDRKAYQSAKRPGSTLLGVSRRSYAVTPGRRSPLRKSWGPDQLAKIDAKLQTFRHGSPAPTW